MEWSQLFMLGLNNFPIKATSKISVAPSREFLDQLSNYSLYFPINTPNHGVSWRLKYIKVAKDKVQWWVSRRNKKHMAELHSARRLGETLTAPMWVPELFMQPAAQ